MFAFVFSAGVSIAGLAVYSTAMEKKQKNFDQEWEAEGSTA
jgi:hypothetical protein